MSWIVTLTKCSPKGLLSDISYPSSIDTTSISGDYDDRFWFDVSGISTWPSAGDVYSNNGSEFTIRTVQKPWAGLDTERTTGSNDPSGSILTKVSGGGDASITFTDWNDETLFLSHDDFGGEKEVLDLDRSSPSDTLLKIEPDSVAGMSAGDKFSYVYATSDHDRTQWATNGMEGTPILWDMEIDSVSGSYIWLKGVRYYTLDKKEEPQSIEDITFEALGVQPSLIDESERIDYWGGGYRKVPLQRLAIKIRCYPFITRGNFDSMHGNKTYWDIMRVLYGNNSDIFIKDLGSNFERWGSGNLQSLFNDIRFPLRTELYDITELSADFQNNRDELDFTLVSPERMDLE